MGTTKTGAVRYLQKKKNAYYARVRAPLDLCGGANDEVWKSLGTSDRREALERLPAAVAAIREEFEQRRAALGRHSGVSTLKPITLEEIGKIAALWVRSCLRTDEQDRAEGLDDEDYDALTTQLSDAVKGLGQAMARGNVMAVEPALSGFLFMLGRCLPTDAAKQRQIRYRFLQSAVKMFELRKTRHEGRLVDVDQAVPEDSVYNPPENGSAGQNTAGVLTFDRAFKAWNESVTGRPAATVLGYHQAWQALKKELGHDNARLVTREDLEDHAKTLQSQAKPLSWKTVRRRLSMIRTILVASGIDTGSRVKIVKPAAESKKRIPFSTDDLEVIFSNSVFTEGKRPTGGGGEAVVWLPTLAFYTGARLEELAQLRVDNFKHDTKLGHYLNIERSEDQQLKTDVSERRVPVHPRLIALGFLDYVNSIRTKDPKGGLFPDLKKDTKGKWSGNWSKWWNPFALRKAGITDPRLTFHSFRHLYKDLCREAGIPQEVHDALTGHTNESASSGYGSGRYPLKPLVAAVKRIEFPDVDIPVLYKKPNAQTRK